MSTLLTLLATTAVQAVIWYFIVRGVRRRAYAEGWNIGYKWREVPTPRQRAFNKAAPAALRICHYFAKCRPDYLNALTHEDKIEFEDFQAVSAYHGISTGRYEG